MRKIVLAVVAAAAVGAGVSAKVSPEQAMANVLRDSQDQSGCESLCLASRDVLSGTEHVKACLKKCCEKFAASPDACGQDRPRGKPKKK
jgi:hypothetical protein